MKFLRHFLFAVLFLGLAGFHCSNGIDFFGMFRRSSTTKASTTTTTPTPAQPSTTGQPAVPQNINSKTCWWTPCASRCPPGSQVAGAGACEGKKNVYKFNCCQG